MPKFWGAVTEIIDLGVVAEWCPHCEQIMPCLLRSVCRGHYACFVKTTGPTLERSLPVYRLPQAVSGRALALRGGPPDQRGQSPSAGRPTGADQPVPGRAYPAERAGSRPGRRSPLCGRLRTARADAARRLALGLASAAARLGPAAGGAEDLPRGASRGSGPRLSIRPAMAPAFPGYTVSVAAIVAALAMGPAFLWVPAPRRWLWGAPQW